MVNQTTLDSATNAWVSECQPMIQTCYSSGTNTNCKSAEAYCNTNILQALYGPWDPYYVPTTSPDSYPAKASHLLNKTSFKKLIGADGNYTAHSTKVSDNFLSTGDWMRNYRPDLEYIIDHGVRTLLFDGDADFVFNYIGFENMVDGLETSFQSQYASQQWQNYTVEGQLAGQYKTAGGLSYLRVYGAGHKVAAYAVSIPLFKMILCVDRHFRALPHSNFSVRLQLVMGSRQRNDAINHLNFIILSLYILFTLHEIT